MMRHALEIIAAPFMLLALVLSGVAVIIIMAISFIATLIRAAFTEPEPEPEPEGDEL